MQAYFVRVASDHEAVGIFVADGIEMLCDLVDECTHVSRCEYLPAGQGGLFIPTTTVAKLPAREMGDDFHPDDEHPFDGAVLSEPWGDVLRRKDRWKTLAWPPR